MFRIDNSDGRIRIPRVRQRQDEGCAIRMRGFTLLESLVATTVFAISIVSMIGVYLSVQRLNQQSASLQALQQNGRFIMEDLSKTIRNGAIDYANYGATIVQPSVSLLYLLDQEGKKITVRKVGDNLTLERVGIGTSNYNSREVRVLSFSAFVWPDSNPIPAGNEQPTVTIYLELESNINPKVVLRLPMQTTITTRQYD